MQDGEIREQTASEPLTLDEEYAMQRSWAEDSDKLTFIVLARVGDTLDLRSLPMIGDVNLFFRGARDEEDFEVEAEVMIAELAYRRQGLAQEALSLLLRFATTSPTPTPSPNSSSSGSSESLLSIPSTSLIARIGASNTASRALFEKLGFKLARVVEVFDEVEMRYIAGAGSWEGRSVEVKAYE